MAYVYNPRGTCIGNLITDRLHLLRQRYTHLQNSNPDLHQKLAAPAGFEEDIARLLLRYKGGHGRKVKGADPRAHATLDDELVRILTTSLRALQAGPVIERYASPLNCTGHAD